jgi:phage baseplate assembly protein W
MSYDLYLTDSGDFAIGTSTVGTNDDKFEYIFHIAPTDSLLFNFNIENNETQQRVANQLDYNFYIYTPKYDKIAIAITDKDYIQQAIKIRLDTELGTIKGNEDIGTDIYTLIHKDPTKTKIRKQICDKVKVAISDVLTNCTVSIQLIQSKYLDYHDSVRIVIVNDEEIYYYYL